jgi:hypothetical protein
MKTILPHMKTSGHDLVPVNGCSFWCPHTAKTGPRMLDDLQTHPKVVLHPLLEGFTSIPAIHPDHLETRQVSSQIREQQLASCPTPYISSQHFDAQQQPLRVPGGEVRGQNTALTRRGLRVVLDS